MDTWTDTGSGPGWEPDPPPLPEQTALPGEPAPPLPDSAYPPDAIPLPDPMVVNARTIDGMVYLAGPDIVAALRHRAAQVTAEALTLGDQLDGDTFVTAVTLHAIAAAMNQRADEIQFAIIAHQEAQ